MRLAPAIFSVLLLSLAGCGGSSHSATTQSTSSPAVASFSTSTATSTSSSTSTAPASTQPDQIKELFISSLRSSLVGSGLPAAYTNCVVHKAQTELTSAQVAKLALLPAGQRTAAGQALGQGYGRQCIEEGTGISAFRQIFLTSLTKTLSSSSLSGAYQRCLTEKARQVSRAELLRLFISEYASKVHGGAESQALGRQLGRECISEGIRP